MQLKLVLAAFVVGFSEVARAFRVPVKNKVVLRGSRFSPLLGAATSTSRQRCDDYAATMLRRPHPWGGPILGPLIRYINSVLVGILFSFLLGVLNRFRAHRVEDLLKLVFHRPKGRPLLTVSNHQSVMDDPGLWALLLPYLRLRPEQLRWQICTEDVFFANKHLQRLIALGNCMPLDRTGSWLQPLFERFYDKLVGGSWCHIFPEGRVFQNWRFAAGEQRLGPFKPGVGKLVAHCPPGKEPIVLPLYHTGMDSIVPEVVLSHQERMSKKRLDRPAASKPVSLKPNTGCDIRYFVGKPLDFTEKVRLFREEHPGVLDSWNTTTWASLRLYREISNDIRQAVLELEREAWGGEEDIKRG